MRKVCRRIFCVILICIAVTGFGFWLWSKCDSQAIPKTVDFVRGIIGDKKMLALEQGYYSLQNSIEEKKYNLFAGSAKASDEVTKPAETPKATSFFEHQQVKGEVGHKIDIATIDRDKADLHLVCGTRDPAKGVGRIPKEHRKTVGMAFSGGFQYKHDFCGIALSGKCLRPMKKSAGTIVVYNDGRVEMGKWERDYKKVTPEMRYVRQGLLLIDGKKFNASAPYNTYALDGKTRVFRSALGLTRGGKLVYAAGNASAKGLAEAMIKVGVVTAVHLDMNYGNATCGVVTHCKGKMTIKPLSSQFPKPDRFLATDYRDFFYLTKI